MTQSGWTASEPNRHDETANAFSFFIIRLTFLFYWFVYLFIIFFHSILFIYLFPLSFVVLYLLIYLLFYPLLFYIYYFRCLLYLLFINSSIYNNLFIYLFMIFCEQKKKMQQEVAHFTDRNVFTELFYFNFYPSKICH